jgi:hypothetical protein
LFATVDTVTGAKAGSGWPVAGSIFAVTAVAAVIVI